MEERIQILEMLVAGKLTIEEADVLLEVLASEQSETQTEKSANAQSNALQEAAQVWAR
jgi:hypothetical protein